MSDEAKRRTVEEVRAWLIDALATELKLDRAKIDPHQPFTRYGADSLTLVTLGGELEEFLDMSIPPSVMWEYPTVASLAAALVEGPEAASREDVHDEPDDEFGVDLEELSDEALDEMLGDKGREGEGDD